MSANLNNLLLALLPSGLMTGASILISRDTDSEGADDAVGQILMAMVPVVPDLLDGSLTNKTACLKAMRAVEKVAHGYRVMVGDVVEVNMETGSPTPLPAWTATSAGDGQDIVMKYAPNGGQRGRKSKGRK